MLQSPGRRTLEIARFGRGNSGLGGSLFTAPLGKEAAERCCPFLAGRGNQELELANSG
jgi:hypothetical protein